MKWIKKLWKKAVRKGRIAKDLDEATHWFLNLTPAQRLELKRRVKIVVDDDQLSYGVYEYNPREKAFHEDVMKVLHKEKHREIPADECMVVFGRIYATYVLSQMKKEKKIKIWGEDF